MKEEVESLAYTINAAFSLQLYTATVVCNPSKLSGVWNSLGLTPWELIPWRIYSLWRLTTGTPLGSLPEGFTPWRLTPWRLNPGTLLGSLLGSALPDSLSEGFTPWRLTPLESSLTLASIPLTPWLTIWGLTSQRTLLSTSILLIPWRSHSPELLMFNINHTKKKKQQEKKKEKVCCGLIYFACYHSQRPHSLTHFLWTHLYRKCGKRHSSIPNTWKTKIRY